MKKVSFNTGWTCSASDGRKVEISLPYDAMIHEARAPKGSSAGHAYFPGGTYTYEKRFYAPTEWKDQNVYLEFEGVYRNSVVLLNGTKVGGCKYGYVPYRVDLTDKLTLGKENTITVIADNSEIPNSRWYTGSGIYRPVNLMVADKTHIESVRVSTLSWKPATIKVETVATGGDVYVEILEGDTVVAGSLGTSVTITIPDAMLWSDEAPNLYRYRVTVSENGHWKDTEEGTFGIRTIEWSNQGLFVNGKETLLRGGCYHHDNGILGAAAYAESEDRRVRIMKEAGFNALRSSHNPTSEAFLRACDKYGVYLVDETWDMWYNKKNTYDYANDFVQNWKRDIDALIERDYNHPSVIMYSVGNEVSEPVHEKGVELTRALVEYCHAQDSSRPVTAGINLGILYLTVTGRGGYGESAPQDGAQPKEEKGGMSSTMYNMIASFVGSNMNKCANTKHADRITTPCLDALDIAGYNYASGRYPKERTAHPNRVVLGTETFPQDIYKNWQMVKKYPYLIGDFMWTAWDYLGEVGIGTWAYTEDGRRFDKPYPWLLADVGVFDILGNPNGELYQAQAAWGMLEKPVICVRPVNHPGTKPAKSTWRGTNSIESWSWSGCDGNQAIIEVFANDGTVELCLNGIKLGRKKLREGKATYKCKYAPGKLEAVRYNLSGREVARTTMESAVGKISIAICPEVPCASAGEVIYIPIRLIGENEVIERNADKKLSVSIIGGELMAFGSANPRTEETYDSGTFATYYGEALAVVRAGDADRITISVSNGVHTAIQEIEVK